MKKLNLLSKFSLISLLALLFIGFGFGWIISANLESNMTSRAAELLGKFILQEVEESLIMDKLNKQMLDNNYDNIKETIQEHMAWLSVVQIKIWDSDASVVWSYDKHIIGKRYIDDDEVAEAIQGEIVSELTSKKFTEEGREQSYERLLELYVPIDQNGDGKVDYVFEVYQDIESLIIDIARQKKILWIAVISSFSVLYLLLISMVKGASSLITTQTEKITLSEKQYRNLVESAPEAIISIDMEGKIILFNKAAEKNFGYSEKEMIGKLVSLLVPEEYREEHMASINRYVTTGESKILGTTVDVEALKKSGEKFPVKLSLSAIKGDGAVTITGILRDISQRKAMEKQLVEKERQASVAIIASSIGHELNNIVGGLLGYANMLKKKSGEPEYVNKCSEIFSTQSERLALHARNLLTLGKPSEPVMRPILINTLLDNVTEMLVVSGVLKTYSIERYYTEDLPAIQVDPELLEQLIRNLEINAAHAMGNQGILKLSTRLSDDSSHVEFSVGDTGHGIPRDRRHQIFLPFFTTKEKGKGTGLGMYIIKQIIEQHSGYIHIDSEVGVGTTAMVGLPV